MDHWLNGQTFLNKSLKQKNKKNDLFRIYEERDIFLRGRGKVENSCQKFGAI